MTAITIGKAAKEAGVSVETIRFYERQGLIRQPPKPARSVRRYSNRIIREIRFIKEAQQLGFTLRQAGELLNLRSDPAADCSAVRAHALAKRDEVKQKIYHLQQIDKALAALIEQCPGCGSLHDCSIIESLENAHSDSTLAHRGGKQRHGAGRTMTLSISGLRCPACANKVESLIARQPGVRSADVSYSAGQARLVVAESWAGSDALIRILAKHGYAVAPAPEKAKE